jgi:hypothetical protein
MAPDDSSLSLSTGEGKRNLFLFTFFFLSLHWLCDLWKGTSKASNTKTKKLNSFFPPDDGSQAKYREKKKGKIKIRIRRVSFSYRLICRRLRHTSPVTFFTSTFLCRSILLFFVVVGLS